MKIIFGACFAIIALFVNISPVLAATDWNNVPANDFVKIVNDEIENSQNAKIDSLSASYVYKKMGDKKTIYYTGKSLSGSFYNSSSTNSFTVSSSTYLFEMGKTRPKIINTMSVVSDGKDIYFKVDGLKNKSLRNKWIKSTAAQYDTIGNGLRVNELFLAFDNSTIGESKIKYEKIYAAQKKSQYWQRYTEEIDDDFTVANATRYNFEPKESAIKPYYTEIQNTLTLKEVGYAAKSYADFLENLTDDAVTEFMAENSYMSVWIDTVSKKPVRIVTIEWIPVTEKKKTVFVLNFTDTEISGYNVQPKLVLPSTSTDAVSAAQLLKIKL